MVVLKYLMKNLLLTANGRVKRWKNIMESTYFYHKILCDPTKFVVDSFQWIYRVYINV